MEYWSFGVMGEIWTNEYKPCFRVYRSMRHLIGQSGRALTNPGWCKYITTMAIYARKSFIHYSNTPVLPSSIPRQIGLVQLSLDNRKGFQFWWLKAEYVFHK